MLATVTAATTLGGCASGPKVDLPTLSVPGSIVVTSPEFSDGAALPSAYTCFGEGAFPAIRWSQLPAGTESVAVVVYDPDAKGGDYVHRLTTDLDPTSKGLPDAGTPVDAVEYATSKGEPGWTPPCPPDGSGVHHYVFWVLALDRVTRIPPETAHTQNVLLNVTGSAFAQGSITGTVDAGS
jgi:Raf kinase inhibitor-like YbhB/YbcL family protein